MILQLPHDIAMHIRGKELCKKFTPGPGWTFHPSAHTIALIPRRASMYKVSSTSGFVLLLIDKSHYEAPSAQRLWDRLDLEPSRPLYKEVIHLWDKLPFEVSNRKFGIKNFSTEFLLDKPHAQVIFLGAGLDPKSLDIAESFPKSKVFDVDMDNMELKEKIIKEIQGPNNISFCRANIAKSEEILDALKEKGMGSKRGHPGGR